MARKEPSLVVRKGVFGCRGFSLIELIVAMVIIAVLAAIAIPQMKRFVERTRFSRAMSELRSIEKDIISFALSNDSYPNSLNDINRGGMKDPWGNPYQYANLAGGTPPRQSMFFTDLNTDFDLYSIGPDGVSQQVISDPASLDDVVRAGDGSWVGRGETF
ncbi:prepilin-type N-terminal cleavage/methylation domain-containing protein [Geothermobacter hydrogeniphilus]|uniref:prepilin-type N-terminal cleavage/methylation domain-containing protein n=1 Tax=Geothermobacter hydrogeniphilus TaxID=1969733 RepID=UPI001304A8F9|nr:prepilin-type N-terminal cleavage/methylation domain-containing protein [Geothermobacter hydrogeniphilus]